MKYFISLFILLDLFCMPCVEKYYENKIVGKDLSCYLKTDDREFARIISYFFYPESLYHKEFDFKITLFKNTHHIKVHDTMNKRLKNTFLKNKDVIIKIDNCPGAFDAQRKELLQYNYLPKAYFLIFKPPHELVDKIEKVVIKRDGEYSTINIKEYASSQPITSREDLWPEVNKEFDSYSEDRIKKRVKFFKIYFELPEY
ncbi:MAG: hypothetical protein H7A25_25880 [Leptospiraceae bacterium]|nr:hypothetical protein [Leptospiraceae bacterium]